MTEIEVLLEMGEEYARKTLLDHRHKELIPSYHLIGADDSHHLVHCPWENDLQKKIHFAVVKEQAQKIRCRAYCFVSEGWSSTNLGMSPSRSPDRIEVVNITAGNATGNETAVLHMVRDMSPGMNSRVIALQPMNRLYNSEGPLIDGLVQSQERSH